jgi:hypothetical protein
MRSLPLYRQCRQFLTGKLFHLIVNCRTAVADDKNRTARELSPIANATMMYNAVDSPVGVLPVTRVDPTKDALKDGKWPVSKTAGSSIVSQACQRAYDAKAMSGVPIGIQVRVPEIVAPITRLIYDMADCGEEVGG